MKTANNSQIKKQIQIIAKKIMFYSKKYTYILLLFFGLFIFYLTLFKLEPLLDKTSNYKFSSLQDIEKYANFYPEDYAIDNNDWENPSFINLYKNTLKHSVFDKLFVKFGIKDEPIFNIQEFTKLLEKVSTNRINQKFINPYDIDIKLKHGDKCIIFGGLHGAFHSFVRNLLEIKRQKIVDNNLKIISPDTYIIFLGDTINRAPYSLEILNAIFLLLERNPEKVIYLQGNHETNGYWRNFNMRRQIQALFPEHANTKKDNNLFDKLDILFNTLPNAITINLENKEKIILSYSEKPKLYQNKNNVKVMILGEKRFNILTETKGLEFLNYDNGVAKWTTMVCPTVVYERFFNFHYDVFLELSIGKSAINCILTLNNRDMREKNSPYKQTSYDPLIGTQIKNKSQFITKNILYIGSTIDLSGINSAIGNEYEIGLEAAIFSNNKNNNNNLIIPVILDDGYSTRFAKENINKLLNTYSINTILSPLGTPTLLFYLDMIKAGKIYVFFPNTGSEIFRDKNIKNILHLRPSYIEEVKTSINYLIKTRAIKNFAFFYQNDLYGKPITDMAHEELKKGGIKSWTDLPHLKTQENFDDTIEILKAYMPEALGCFSSATTTKEFIEELGTDFFTGRILFGPSVLFSGAFKQFLDDRGIKYILTEVVPSLNNGGLELVEEFKKEMKLKGLNINTNSLEGYISGSLFADAANKIKPPFTAAKIMEHFEGMKNYNFKGLNLTFNPEKRDLSQPVWLRTLDLKWLIYKY